MSPVSESADGPVKFAVPVAIDVIDRPRLRARLTAGLAHPVTVIAAAAGWGKTLLAASWIATGAGGRTAAWVSLEKGDDDPRTFWSTLCRSLLPVTGPASGAVFGRVVADEGADAEDLPGRFATGMRLAERPVLLVLDNLHEVNSPAVHEGLLRLIERPPPTLSMLVITRRDPPWPLEYLRLAGLLTQIGTDELGFTAHEAAALFARLHLELTAAQRQILLDRTEGWPAGLRLAALRLQSRGDRDAAVAAFTGDSHSVADYLVSEVLDGQPQELITFLHKISIVDLVCADLADALTGRHDGAELLTRLAASHLFVQAIDRPGRWYRLHRLLADVLRARPAARRERRDLQRRAAEWFSQHTMPLQAISAAVAGELWPLAAQLVATQVITLVMSGHARELDRTLAAVPHTAMSAHPELACGLAGARVVQGDPGNVAELLDAARAAAAGIGGRRAARAHTLVELVAGALARLRGDWNATTAIYHRVLVDPHALAQLDIAGTEIVPVIVNNNLGTAALWGGDLADANRYLQAAVAAHLSQPALTQPALSQLNAAGYLALLRCERGELDVAQAEAGRVIAAASSAGRENTLQMGGAYLAMAHVALDRNDIGEIDDWLGRLADIETVNPEPHVRLAAALILSARREATGDREHALSGLATTTADIDTHAMPQALTERWLLAEACLLARGGDPHRARKLVEQLGPIQSPAGLLAAARLHLLLHDLPTALAVRARIRPDNHPRALVETALLDTLLAAAHSEQHNALDRLEDALTAAAPWQLRRVFLAEAPELRAQLAQRIEHGTVAPTFAQDLLQRMSTAPVSQLDAQRARIEPLTERDRTILRYLDSNLTTEEIAAELYVSVTAMKTYQRTLYRKLGAASRRTAVLRAHELHLL
jgi:LuxR family maltose regulon positive regulatory protein